VTAPALRLQTEVPPLPMARVIDPGPPPARELLAAEAAAAAGAARHAMSLAQLGVGWGMDSALARSAPAGSLLALSVAAVLPGPTLPAPAPDLGPSAMLGLAGRVTADPPAPPPPPAEADAGSGSRPGRRAPGFSMEADMEYFISAVAPAAHAAAEADAAAAAADAAPPPRVDARRMRLPATPHAAVWRALRQAASQLAAREVACFSAADADLLAAPCVQLSWLQSRIRVVAGRPGSEAHAGSLVAVYVLLDAAELLLEAG